MIWGPVLRKLALVLLAACAAGVLADRMGLLRLDGHAVIGAGAGDTRADEATPQAALELGGGIAAAALQPSAAPAPSQALLPDSAAPTTPVPAATTEPSASPPPPLPTTTGSALPPSVPLPPAPPPVALPPHLPECATEPQTDRPGNDLGTSASQEPSAAACCSRCSETPRCRAWTFVLDSSTCWLKGAPRSATGSEVDAMPPGVPSDCCTSGLAPAGSGNAFGAASASGHSINGAAAAAAAAASKTKGADALRGGGGGSGGAVASGGGGPPSLVIAIPTIPRHKGPTNIDYLTGTVESLVRESLQASKASTTLFSSVEILVLSHVVDEEHPDFVALRTKYAGGDEVGTVPLPGRQGLGELRLRFLSDGGTLRNLDPHKDDQPVVDDRKNPEDRPGVRVRQQSKDVIALIMAAEKVGADYVLFTEDDAELCAGTLPKVASAVQHANKYTAQRGAVRSPPSAVRAPCAEVAGQ